MARAAGALILLLTLLVTSLAWAQPGGTVVVIADVAREETANAQLRAQLYETARQKGYQPEPQANVTEAAAAAGAMEAGEVVSDAARLEALRKALGARLLVRVTGGDAGVRLQVLSPDGVKEKTVARQQDVNAALAELLGAAPASASTARAEGPAQGVGYITDKKDDGGPPPDSPEGIRAAWENRGGVRAMYGIRALVTALASPDSPYADRNPATDALETGKATTYGVGGGLGAHISLLYLPLPAPPDEGKTWAAFRLGTGLDLNVLYVRPPIGYNYRIVSGEVSSRDTQYDDKAIAYAIIPFQLGVHFGFGEFRSPTLWRGVALGIAYSPALIASLEIGKKQEDAESDFNYAGFELSLDITKLETTETANSNIRLSVMVLPHINDELPWLISGGIGAVWY
jgi:hypothetical protein